MKGKREYQEQLLTAAIGCFFSPGDGALAP